jgi:hypothetical protein
MKIYQGYLDRENNCVVTVMDGEKEYPLPHVEIHAPPGFGVGDEGVGPADLSLREPEDP